MIKGATSFALFAHRIALSTPSRRRPRRRRTSTLSYV